MILKKLYKPRILRNYSSLAQINHNTLNDSDIKAFQSILQSQDIKRDASELELYNVDWMNKYIGNSKLVLQPRTVEQVSKVLEYCNKRNLPIVPQGGNTGLVGGSVPIDQEIVLSLSKMDQIKSLDKVSGIITCEAGCILENLSNYLANYALMMPLDLGAKGSCQIGGNIATNAGGLRLLRYGGLHGTVLGLQVVLADGTILDNLSTLRKDNTGYDLKQLFIGSEGTLGVITAASILTPTLPKTVNVALLGLESFDKVMETFKVTRQHLSEILSAFEFFDAGSLKLVQKHQGLKSPLEREFPYYILIETHGSNKEHDDEKLSNLLEALMEQGIVADGTVAQDNTQVENIWKYRESIPESVVKDGKAYKYDFSVPLPHFYTLVEKVEYYLKEKGYYVPNDPNSIVNAVVGFGHIGDSNLHLNIVGKKEAEDLKRILEPYVFELVSQFKGSISAEHGMGAQKNNFIHYSKSKPMVNLMFQFKKLLDPNNILNPKKVLPY